jgi:hypothetical protein
VPTYVDRRGRLDAPSSLPPAVLRMRDPFSGSHPSATADREIVISRVIDAPRELVFEAFTEVRHLSRWW